TIPLPGPLKNNLQDLSFTFFVRFIGSLQVSPSSSLYINTNCPVCEGSSPDLELPQALLPFNPWIHNAATHNLLVLLSYKIAASPTPFCAFGNPPNSPISKIGFILDQLCPLSVLT